MPKKLKLKTLTPMFDGVLVTANRYPKEEKLIQQGRILKLREMPNEIKTYQKVLACGPSAHNIHVGDDVMINFLRYKAAGYEESPNQDKPDTIRMQEKISLSLPILEVDGQECLLIRANDIIYTFTGEEVDED